MTAQFVGPLLLRHDAFREVVCFDVRVDGSYSSHSIVRPGDCFNWQVVQGIGLSPDLRRIRTDNWHCGLQHERHETFISHCNSGCMNTFTRPYPISTLELPASLFLNFFCKCQTIGRRDSGTRTTEVVNNVYTTQK